MPRPGQPQYHTVGEIMAAPVVTVRDLMTSPLIAVSPDTPIRQCSIIMLDANIRRAVVLKEGKLVGIVGDTDIFQAVEERGWGPE